MRLTPHATGASAAGGRSIWIWILATLIGGLGLRVVAFLAWHDGAFFGEPGFEDAVYWQRWQTLIDPGTEAALPWGAPAYGYLLAWLGAIVGHTVTGIQVVQSLLGLALAPVLAWALRPLLLPRHCWMAAFAYAIHPLGPYFELRLTPVVWIVGLVLVTARLLFLATGPDRSRSVVGGLLLGAGILLRPFLFLVLAAAAVWARRRAAGQGARAAAWRGAVILLVAAAALPLLICGYHATLGDGAFAWNWSDAYAFHRGLEPETWGTPRAADPPAWTTPEQAESIAQQAEARMLTHAEMAAHFRREGLGALLARPVTAAGNLLARSALLLSAHEIPDPVSPTAVFTDQAPYLAWGLHLFPAILGLAGVGFWFLSLDGRAGRLLVPVVALAAANVLGLHSAATRWPLAVLLLPAAILTLTQLPALLRRSPLQPPRWLLPLAALLVVLSALDLPGARTRFEDRSEDRREEARMHLERQDTRGATRLLREAIDFNPENALAHSDLALVHRHEELAEAAREQYEQALAVDPACEPALYGLAELLRLQKSYAEAESLALKLVNLHPNHPLYWNELGAIATQMHKFPQARLALQRALQLFPDYRAAQTTLQSIATAQEQAGAMLLPPERMPADDGRLAQLGRDALGALPAGALAVADSVSGVALAEFPDDPFAWYVRGAVLLRLGQPDEAARLLERMVRAEPGRMISTQMAARALYDAGRVEQAKALVLFSLENAAGAANARRLAKMAESMGLEVEMPEEDGATGGSGNRGEPGTGG